MARFRDIIYDNERLRAENSDLREKNARATELLENGRARIRGLLEENQNLQTQLSAALMTVQLLPQAVKCSGCRSVDKFPIMSEQGTVLGFRCMFDPVMPVLVDPEIFRACKNHGTV